MNSAWANICSQAAQPFMPQRECLRNSMQGVALVILQESVEF